MKLQMSQTQQPGMKLMLKPELQQSLQMLQLTGDELYRYLIEQAAENPMLEVEEPPAFTARKRLTAGCSPEEPDSLWKARAGKETLEQDLLRQLRIAGVRPELYRIAAFLAGNLDGSGYLAISVSETAALLRVPSDAVNHALRMLQSMEPAGIGARSLKENLLLQIERDPEAVPGAYEAVNLCLPLLAQGKWERMGLQIGKSEQEARRIAAYVRRLNPRPWQGAEGAEDVHYIVPDAYISVENGRPAIRFNPESIPKVTVNRDYVSEIGSVPCPRTSGYLREKTRNAMSLLHGLKQRQATLLRVVDAIFAEQELYLDQGERSLKPLTLKNISEKLQIHESTVSRAVQNKHVRTPYGLRELKFFFSAGLQTEAGDYASAKRIKNRLKELVAQENKSRPLSDQNIVDLLKREGVVISRRTVTKYREEMNVLSSVLRKSIL